MTARAKKPAEPVLVTDWYGHDQKPVHVGKYQVREETCSRDILTRWWDGSDWRVREGGSVSYFGGHHSHQWRGQRMWVLVRRTRADLADGGLINPYLVAGRPRGAKWSHLLEQARPFKTERQAQRFAARYAHLGLTAVLP